jgi:pseudouridylate synthase
MPVDLSDDVSQAIARRRGVVALESAVLTHGLPLEAADEAVLRQGRACTAEGAVPAVVGVFQGRLRVGLSEEECRELARHPAARKVSGWNLAGVLADPGFGGTTVATTVRAASLAGIRVVSTGGLGGVHRGRGEDVSSDLQELATRRICVVCSGPKSILDVPATVERLETLGVPLVGWRSDRVAGFLATSTDLPVAVRVDGIPALKALVLSHWQLGGAGVVVSRPLEGEQAIPAPRLAEALETLSEDGGGAGRTPADLERVRQKLGVDAISANLALLEANARLAGALARALLAT